MLMIYFVLQEAFVLLDLIGAKSPKFPNFFDKTSNLYEQFMNIGMHSMVAFKMLLL